MEKAKKVFSRVMSVLSVLMFVFGLFIFITVLNASAGKVPSVLGFSFLQVQTGSMEPELPVGTIVITKNTDPKELKKGDIISFYSTDKEISQKVVTHRIVDITTNMKGYPTFTTKGDANDIEDRAPVSNIMVIGKVVYNIGTASGSVISVLKNPKVIFFFIVLPLIFITFGEAVNLVTLIVNSKEEEKEEENGQSGEEEN